MFQPFHVAMVLFSGVYPGFCYHLYINTQNHVAMVSAIYENKNAYDEEKDSVLYCMYCGFDGNGL